MQQQASFSIQDHTKRVIVDAWSAAWDQGRVDAFDEIVTEDYERRSTNSGQSTSIEGVKSEILDIRSAFPDLETVVDRILIEGDEAAVYWHSTGTFTEPLNGVPPTGSTVATHGSNFITLREGRVASEEVTWDARALLADLGLKSLSSAFETHDVSPVVDNLSGNPSREALKAFNRQFITGVTVVTTKDEEGRPRGLAVNSFNSVSLDPPLVLVCVQKTSSTYPAMFRAKHIGINIVSRDQRETLGVFASKAQDKFDQVSWHEGEHGSPLIDGSSASIEVEVKERFQALTHTVFIGRVRSAEAGEDSPMIYQAGKFYDSLGLEPLD